MANDFVTRLTNDASQFNQSFDEATGKVEKFTESTKDADKSVKDLGRDGVKSTRDLLKEIAQMSGAERSVSNYRRQLAQMTRDIQDLTINYNNLTEAQKNSAAGKETLARIQELTVQAGKYKDAVLDAQKAISAMASDTANWDAAKQGLDLLSSSLQVFVSTGVLGKKSTEDLVKVLARLRAIETATNAVIKIGNALQKQSALMMGISRLQALALSKAKDLETAATVRATIAQKAFNVIAKANPYVLLATAVLAIGTALITFTKKTNDATEAEKKHAEALKAEEEAANEYRKTIGSAIGEVVSKYKLLQLQFSKLKSDSEKNRWIKQNQSDFEQLGLKVKDLKSAEDTFINNTTNVVEALKKRAMAAAKQGMLTDLYTRLYTEQQLADDNYNRRKVSAGSVNRASGHSTASGEEYVNQRTGQWVYTEKGAKNANKRIYNETHATVKKIQGEIDTLASEIASALDISSYLKSGNGDGLKEIIPEVGSLAAAQNEVTKLETALNNMSPDNEKFEQTKEALKKAKEEVERIQKLLKEEEKNKTVFSPGSLNEANGKIKEIQDELNNTTPNTPRFKELLELLRQWEQKVKEIKEQMEESVPEDLLSKYQRLKNEAGDIQTKLDIKMISPVEAQRLLNEIKAELEKEGIKLDVELDFHFDESKLGKVVDNINKKMNDWASVITDPINSVDSLISSFENLKKVSEDPDSNGWERFFAVFKVGEAILSTTSSLLSAVTTVTDLLTAAKERSATASIQEMAAEQANVGVKAEETAASLSAAAAKGAEAGAGAAASVSAVPIAGPVLAIAAIAAVMAAIIAAISKAKGFSTGGVVGGSSTVGDKIFARLNSGELVLNRRQQDVLWKDLNKNVSYNGSESSINIPSKITLTAKGTELEAVLDNTRRRVNKI